MMSLQEHPLAAKLYLPRKVVIFPFNELKLFLTMKHIAICVAVSL